MQLGSYGGACYTGCDSQQDLALKTPTLCTSSAACSDGRRENSVSLKMKIGSKPCRHHYPIRTTKQASLLDQDDHAGTATRSGPLGDHVVDVTAEPEKLLHLKLQVRHAVRQVLQLLLDRWSC